VDTPGLQLVLQGALNRHMNREIRNALAGVDVVVFITTALKWGAADDRMLAAVREYPCPVVLVLNKIDRIPERARLLPFINGLPERDYFSAVVPVSARTGENIERLEDAIRDCLPPGKALFPEDQVTDQNMRFIAAEFIREKLMRRLGAELPYRLSVTIERYEEKPGLTLIDAVIWVETTGQKAIVIGTGGVMLKKVGTEARLDLEQATGGKVNLNTWVKVRKGWTADPHALRVMGYSPES